MNKRVPQLAWSLYDFANTIFSMNVVSLYFVLWVTVDHGGKDIYYSLVYSASMLATLVLAPFLGRAADLKNRRLLFLFATTLLCVAATALIGVVNRLSWGFVFFFAANVGFQLGLVFYDSLLPSIARKEEYGKVSGFGVALGYIGSIAGIALVAPFVDAGGAVMRGRAFVPTAVLFFLFALPCFFFVREKKETAAGARPLSFGEILRAIRRYPGVGRYLVTMFFVQDAVNTVILFMSIYAVQVAGFTQKELNYFLMLSTAVAVLAAFFTGRLVDRLGPLRVFRGVIWVWIAGLLLAAVSPNRYFLWAASCFIGTGLGGLWTSSRPLLISMVPAGESATYFGFNVLAGRFASLTGPLLWGLIVWQLEPMGTLRYRAAVAVLGVFVFIGWLVSRGLPGTIKGKKGGLAHE